MTLPVPKEVLERWEATTGAILEPLTGGATTNRRFRLSSKRGTAVLVCHMRERQERRLRAELELRRLLGERGVPVPAIYSSRDGDALVRCEGHWWSLSAWIEGVHYDYEDLEQCRDAGLVLARIHVPADDLPLDPADGYTDGVELWLSGPNVAAERLRRCLHESGVHHARADAWANTFERWANCIAAMLHAQCAGPLIQTWTHGDFHGLNLCFRGHRVTGVLDFETSAVRPRVFDLAYAALMLGRVGRGQYLLRPAWIEVLLAAYESVSSPLEAHERAALQPAMLLSQLPDLGFVESLREEPAALLAELERMNRALQELKAQDAGEGVA